jgi:hypothetical protein
LCHLSRGPGNFLGHAISDLGELKLKFSLHRFDFLIEVLLQNLPQALNYLDHAPG